jgi:hypothetical protein
MNRMDRIRKSWNQALGVITKHLMRLTRLSAPTVACRARPSWLSATSNSEHTDPGEARLDRLVGISQLVRRQSGMLCDACEHTGPDFLVIVKSESEIGPARAGQDAMGRTRLTFDRPTDA